MTSTPSSDRLVDGGDAVGVEAAAGLTPGLPSQQTLYAAILAPGAMPEPVPICLPSIVTLVPLLPAAVDAVWEPWPEPSRGERNSALAMLCLSKPAT